MFRRDPAPTDRSHPDSGVRYWSRVGASILVFDTNMLMFYAKGGTGISASGKGMLDEEGIYIGDANIQWDGVTAKVTLEMLWGRVEVERQWVSAELKNIIGPELRLFP